jgi:hypothetical protein
LEAYETYLDERIGELPSITTLYRDEDFSEASLNLYKVTELQKRKAFQNFIYRQSKLLNMTKSEYLDTPESTKHPLFVDYMKARFFRKLKEDDFEE